MHACAQSIHPRSIPPVRFFQDGRRLAKLTPLRVVRDFSSRPARARIFSAGGTGWSRDGGGARGSPVYSRDSLSAREFGFLLVFGLVRIWCTPLTCVSSVGWLAAATCAAAVVFPLLSHGSTPVHPLNKLGLEDGAGSISRIWRCLLVPLLGTVLRWSELKPVDLGAADYSANKARFCTLSEVVGEAVSPSRRHGGERGRFRAELCGLVLRCGGVGMLESAWLPPCMFLVINDNHYGLMFALSYL